MNQIWNSHKRGWLIGIALLIIAVSVTATSVFTVTRHSSSNDQNNIYFHTLPPGAKLPSSAECARLIRGSLSPESSESRPINAQFNRATGESVPPGFFPDGDSPQAAEFAPLITGDFTGTTQEILEWAACKWGIDQDVVFAQAAVESWWQQTKLGDWTTDVKRCPPGHGLGADGRPGECPQSYGILQNRYSSEASAWPGIAVSTAMNVDAAYAIWRSCYDGLEVWLNEGPKSQPYRAGDLWGCVGRWFTGNWHTPGADEYIDLVKKFDSERIWLQPYFSRTS
jgi:autotransporter family porin